MAEFDRLWLWQQPEFFQQLSWYREVAANRMPAKYLIAARVPAGVSLEAPEEELWHALDAGTEVFLVLWEGIRTGQARLPQPPVGPSLLELCRELSARMLGHCNFCRWHCEVDRRNGTKMGTCKLAADTRVSSYFHHPGEELVFRGTHGSGTIFFTSCNLRCSFCQNGDISTDKDNGQPVSSRELATMAWLLRQEGCHNINWVGGEVTIHLHTIIAAIAHLEGLQPDEQILRQAQRIKADGRFGGFAQMPKEAEYQGLCNAPMLWNSNFFMSEPAMKLLRLLMDVWLPDFKFGPGKCAVKLSRTPWYWETVTQNIKTIHAWNEGFTVRHLVMPNHVECCTRPVLTWLAEHTPGVSVNIMDQYHPDNFCDPRSPKYKEKYEEIARFPTQREIQQALHIAEELQLPFEAITHERRT